MLVPIQNSLHASHIVLSSEVEGRLARCSSSMLSLPSLNALCHLRTKQHPHKLSLTTAMFRNQIFWVSRRTWSRNAAPDSSAFSPMTRHKHYYALCERTDCYKGADSTEEGQTVYLGSSSTCLDPPLSFPGLHCPKKSFSLLLGQTSYVSTQSLLGKLQTCKVWIHLSLDSSCV